MREIKFRGKHIETGEWFEGDYIHETGIKLLPEWEHNINAITPLGYMKMPINIDTLGQYTGFNDNNGKEIYDGDILKISDGVGKPFLVEVYFDDLYGRILVTDHFSYSRNGDNDELYNYATDISYDHALCKIIGNIHDNPELLKEGADK